MKCKCFGSLKSMRQFFFFKDRLIHVNIYITKENYDFNHTIDKYYFIKHMINKHKSSLFYINYWRNNISTHFNKPPCLHISFDSHQKPPCLNTSYAKHTFAIRRLLKRKIYLTCFKICLKYISWFYSTWILRYLNHKF